MTESRKMRRDVTIVLTCIIALTGLTLLGSYLRFTVTAASSVFLVVIILQSLVGDFASSALVSFIAFGYLDYFFTTPKFSLAIADPRDVLGLMSFLLTALVVTRLVSKIRREMEASQIEREKTERLYRLAQELLGIEPKATISANHLEPFRTLFGIEAVCLFDGDTSDLEIAGQSRASLADRTRQAYLQQTGQEDHLLGISTRCLIIGGEAHGAVGFEGTAHSSSSIGPLTALAATVLERIRALRNANQAVATAQSEVYRSAILDALAHEFKTPLATILAAAGGLNESGPLKPEQAEMMKTVETEAAQLGELASRLLRMARLDREQVRPQMERIDIVALLKQLVNRYSKTIIGRRVILLARCESAEVLADPELLRLAIGQLVDNACKYSGPGSTVEVTVVRQQVSAVSIRVANTGNAIASSEKNRIFDRFYRGVRASHVSSGSGLGLYVARKIALAHDGSLDLEDCMTADSTTFRLNIPSVDRGVLGEPTELEPLTSFMPFSQTVS